MSVIVFLAKRWIPRQRAFALLRIRRISSIRRYSPSPKRTSFFGSLSVQRRSRIGNVSFRGHSQRRMITYPSNKYFTKPETEETSTESDILYCSPILLFAFLVGCTGCTFYHLEQCQNTWFDEQSFPLNGDEIIETSHGPIPLPIIYRDGSLVAALYLVDPEVAQSLLPPSMEPLTLPWPINKAVAGIFMFEYRDTSIGEYGEMGLTIQARKAGSGAGLIGFICDMMANIYHLDWIHSFYESTNTGLFVSTLPVTTESAKCAGREIWGFNKYVTGIQSNFKDSKKMTFELENEFEFSLDSKEKSVLPKWATAGLPFLTYTERKEDDEETDCVRIMRTKVSVGHKVEWGGTSKMKIKGKGPTADRMVRLGLDRLKPVAVFRTDSLKAHLPRGEFI